jgi:hypothetical protein
VIVAICTTTHCIVHETAQAASRGRLMVVMGIFARRDRSVGRCTLTPRFAGVFLLALVANAAEIINAVRPLVSPPAAAARP